MRVLGNIGGIRDPEIVRALRRLEDEIQKIDSAVAPFIQQSSLTISHSDLQDLDYASAGHTGFVPATRQVATSTGLSGGGDLSANRTLVLANTAVVAGSYTYAGFTVDAQGRLTAASSGTAPATGSGTTNTLPKWTSSTALGDSSLVQSASGGRLTHSGTSDATTNVQPVFEIVNILADGAYTAGIVKSGLQVRAGHAGGGPSSGSPIYSPMYFDLGSIGGTWGGLVGAWVESQLGSLTSTGYYYGFQSRVDDSFSSATLTKLAHFRASETDNGWSGGESVTDYYVLLDDSVGTGTNQHGWAMAHDSNIVDNKYVYAGAAVSTALASRTAGIKLWDTTNSRMGFDVGTVTALGLSKREALTGISTGSNLGVGKTLAPATITAGATNLLTVGTDEQVQRFTFGAGAGAYTYNIDLDIASVGGVAVPAGSVFWIYIDKPASTNPTITVRNGSGGGNIISINNGTAQVIACVFIYNNTAWVRHAAVVNDF